MKNKDHFPSEVVQELLACYDVEAEAKEQRTGIKVHPEHYRNDKELFIAVLESFGTSSQTLRPERKHQDRKRALQKVANAVGKLADAVNEIDKDAAAFLLYQVTRELEGDKADELSAVAYFVKADTERPELVEVLAAMHRAALSATRDLPVQRTNWPQKVALGIERQFWERGFVFARSETGFAAKTLEAVFTLAGMERSSLQYWVGQALDSEDSMASLTDRVRACMEKG